MTVYVMIGCMMEDSDGVCHDWMYECCHMSRSSRFEVMIRPDVFVWGNRPRVLCLSVPALVMPCLNMCNDAYVYVCACIFSCEC